MDMDLSGRTSIVTGGARGIGKAIVMGLAKEGSRVVICDLDEDAMKAAAGEAEGLGVEVMTYRLNVSKFDEASSMVDAVMKRFGRIDILVNNAGTTHEKKFWESERHDWEVDIESSLYGTLCCSRAVVPHMMEQKSGRIVNISSNAGRIGFRKEIGYVAAKAGVLGVTKAMALELAPYNIAVNVVAPGFIMTEMVKPFYEAGERRSENMHPDAKKERDRIFTSLYPLGRFGYPEDIAGMVVFLCSAKAARYITGQTISVDGGGTMI